MGKNGADDTNANLYFLRFPIPYSREVVTHNQLEANLRLVRNSPTVAAI